MNIGMRYLKTYEDNWLLTDFWVVPTKRPEYWVALDKIDMPENIKKLYWDMNWKEATSSKPAEYVIFTCRHKTWSARGYNWFNYFKDAEYSYIYKGEVKVTQDEVDEFLAKKDAVLYNL
jgi:hypothetical protein